MKHSSNLKVQIHKGMIFAADSIAAMMFQISGFTPVAWRAEPEG